jgi:integrase
MKSSPRKSITAYQATGRHGYCTTFVHPCNGKRINRGLGTNDPTEAKQVCLHLERLVNNPKYWSLKHKILHALHPKAVEIFFEGKKPAAISKKVIVPDSFFYPGTEPDAPGPNGYELDSEELGKERQKNAQLELRVIEQQRDMEALRHENAALRREANKHVTASMQEAVREWKKIYPAGRSAHTVTEASSSVEAFAVFVGHQTLLAAIKGGDIDKWLAAYKNLSTGSDVSPVTKRRVRAYVFAFFSWAVRHYDLSENPKDKTGPIPGLARHPENILAIRNFDGLEMLLSALQPWPYWHAYVAVACLAGPRWSEQINLRVSDVHLDSGYIRIASRSSGRRIVGTKTGRERNIPTETTVLKPILISYLAAHEGHHEWLFPSTVEELKRKTSVPGQWSGNGTFLNALRPILECARVRVADSSANKEKTATEMWSYGPSEWRHCFGTALGNCGFSELEISQFMGNSPEIARRHYIAPGNGKRWPLQWR